MKIYKVQFLFYVWYPIELSTITILNFYPKILVFNTGFLWCFSAFEMLHLSYFIKKNKTLREKLKLMLSLFNFHFLQDSFKSQLLGFSKELWKPKLVLIKNSSFLYFLLLFSKNGNDHIKLHSLLSSAC